VFRLSDRAAFIPHVELVFALHAFDSDCSGFRVTKHDALRRRGDAIKSFMLTGRNRNVHAIVAR
jgi:hypothetical protein